MKLNKLVLPVLAISLLSAAAFAGKNPFAQAKKKLQNVTQAKNFKKLNHAQQDLLEDIIDTVDAEINGELDPLLFDAGLDGAEFLDIFAIGSSAFDLAFPF